MSGIASVGMGQFIGSMVSTAGGAYFGVGALKSFHSLIGITQTSISGLVSVGIEADKNRGRKGSKEQVCKGLQEKMIKALDQDGRDFLKAAAFTTSGFALLVFGELLKGQSMQQIFIDSLGYTFQTEHLAQAFFAAILMTAGDTIMGMAALNTIKATMGLLTTGFSGGDALDRKASSKKKVPASEQGKEEDKKLKQDDKEITNDKLKADDKPKKDDKQSGKMFDRVTHFIVNDTLDIPKSMAAGAFGAAILAVGARFGGISFASSATHFIRAQIV